MMRSTTIMVNKTPLLRRRDLVDYGMILNERIDNDVETLELLIVANQEQMANYKKQWTKRPLFWKDVGQHALDHGTASTLRYEIQ